MNRRTAVGFLLAVAALPAFGEVAYIPPAKQIASADYVVVGRISRIKKRALTVTTKTEKGKKTWHYDVGTVAVARHLKGPPHFKEAEIQVAFLSQPPKGGDKNNFPDYGVYYKDGDEGVWMLRVDYLAGTLIAGYDMQSLIPLKDEQDVVKILETQKGAE